MRSFHTERSTSIRLRSQRAGAYLEAGIETVCGRGWQALRSAQPALGPAAVGYAVAFGGFLTAMLCLTLAEPLVRETALVLRWPVLGAFAALGLVAASHGMRWRGIHAALGLVVALAALSASYAPDAAYSLLRAGSLALLFAATFVGITAYCRSLGHAQLLTDVLWCLGVSVAFAGLFYRLDELGTDGRFTGLHDRATGAGGYLALFLPLALYQTRYRFVGFTKWIGATAIVLLAAELLLTGARMAIVVGGGVSAALALVYFRGRAVLALVLVMVVATTAALLDDRCRAWGARRAEPLLRIESLPTFTGRLDRWRFGWEQFRRRPWLGHGFGVSRTIAGETEPRRFRLKPGDTFLLHSDQIELLVDLGLVGFATFAAVWVLTGLAGRQIVADPPQPARSLALAYLGATTYVFADTFMHGGFLSAGGAVAPFSWSILAVLWAYPQWRR